MTILEQLFYSVPRARILTYLFSNSESFFEGETPREFSLQEVTSNTKISPAKAVAEMNSLVAAGIVQRRKIKKRAFYHLNQQFPLYNELANLILHAEPTSFNDIADQFSKIKGIKVLAVGGIFLKKQGSPVDLIFVAKDGVHEKIREEIESFEKNIGREIKFTLLDEKEYIYRMEVRDKFLTEFFEYPYKVVLGSFEGLPQF